MALPDPTGPFVHEASVPGAATVRIVFGPGVLSQVAGEARLLGTRALLLAGRHEAGYADQVAADLGSRLAGRISEVTEHVPVEVADGAVQQAERTGAEVVVAIGGGSATGLAKAIALRTGLPILAVPTTYAGSEMTTIWGLTDERGKQTGRDPHALPRTVVYDPALTLSLPAGITAASGMNAVAHLVEALYAPDVTPTFVEIAETGLRALAAGLPASVSRPGDIPARSKALYGAWLAGWALGSTRMGLHHKLAHVLGGGYRLPHAGTHSALLPQVAAYNAPAAPEALGRVARALGADGPDQAGAALFDLATALGAPTSLAGLGLPADAIDRVAATVAAGDGIHPRKPDLDSLRALLRDAYAGTRPSPQETS